MPLSTAPHTRRPPPDFVVASVVSTRLLNSRMRRVVLTGDRMDSLVPAQPAASIRVVVPSPGRTHLVIPEWNGNEFLLPDGSRPSLRTFTPQPVPGDSSRLVIDVVVHEGGAVSDWAAVATPGDRAAISGPGRGYEIDPSARSLLVLGDESALPAIGQLIESLPADVAVEVHVETTDPAAETELPDRDGLITTWHLLPTDEAPGKTLVEVAAELAARSELDELRRIWAAGEAASMQAIRKLMFGQQGMPRAHATIRGYWKLR